MTKKHYQEIVDQVGEIIDSEIGVVDISGQIIACSDQKKLGLCISSIKELMDSDDEIIRVDGKLFKKIKYKNRVEILAYINDKNDENIKQLLLFALNINTIKSNLDEKYEKSSLLKSIIYETIIPGEAVLRAKEMNISSSAYRAVYLIRTEKGKEYHSYEIIHNLFPNKSKDYVIIVDNENTLLVKEFKNNYASDEVEEVAGVIVDTLNTELIKAVVGIGTIVGSLSDISRSYSEAQIALKIGDIFEKDRVIVNYTKLGLGRLIYQLPENVCEIFLKEIFEVGVYETLDEEYLQTIQKLFENNLNISEASRKMYIHRNTLVYRLEKIKKVTGLDLTRFDDAIVFKVASLVRRYLDKEKRIV